ncbi:MAG: hypothetical protein AAF587_02645 [Bacteroidota bacterium]
MLRLIVICLTILTLSCSGEDAPLKLAVVIEDWTYEFAPQSEAEIPVQFICGGDKGWTGEVSLRIQQGDRVIQQWDQPLHILADSSASAVFRIELPQEEGKYELVGELIHPEGRPIRNRRLIKVKKPLDLSM